MVVHPRSFIACLILSLQLGPMTIRDCCSSCNVDFFGSSLVPSVIVVFPRQSLFQIALLHYSDSVATVSRRHIRN